VAALSPVQCALPMTVLPDYRLYVLAESPEARGAAAARLVSHAPLLQILAYEEPATRARPVLDAMAEMVDRYFHQAAAVPPLDRTDEPHTPFSSGFVASHGVIRRPPTYTIVRRCDLLFAPPRAVCE
jgi:hypothetical protein